MERLLLKWQEIIWKIVLLLEVSSMRNNMSRRRKSQTIESEFDLV